jgi:hypothetical protein
MFTGPQPDLAQARIRVVADDVATMFVLTIFGGLIAIIGAVALVPYVNPALECCRLRLSRRASEFLESSSCGQRQLLHRDV